MSHILEKDMSMASSSYPLEYTVSSLPNETHTEKVRQNKASLQTEENLAIERKCACCKERIGISDLRFIHTDAGIRKQYTELLYKACQVRITHGAICGKCERGLLRLNKICEKYKTMILDGLGEMIEKKLVIVDYDTKSCDSSNCKPSLDTYEEYMPKSHPDVIKVEMERVGNSNNSSGAPDGVTLILHKNKGNEVPYGDRSKIPYVIKSQKPTYQSKSMGKNKLDQVPIVMLTDYRKKMQKCSTSQKQGRESINIVNASYPVNKFSKEVQQSGQKTNIQDDQLLQKPYFLRTKTVKTYIGQDTASQQSINDDTWQELSDQTISDDETISGDEYIPDMDEENTSQVKESRKGKISQDYTTGTKWSGKGRISWEDTSSSDDDSHSTPIKYLNPTPAQPAKKEKKNPSPNSTVHKGGLKSAQQGLTKILHQAIQRKILLRGKGEESCRKLVNIDATSDCSEQDQENTPVIDLTKDTETNSQTQSAPQGKQSQRSTRKQAYPHRNASSKNIKTNARSEPRPIRMKEPAPQDKQMSFPLVLQNPLMAYTIPQPIQINHPFVLQNPVQSLVSNGCHSITASNQRVSQATQNQTVGALPIQVKSEINCTKPDSTTVLNLPQAMPKVLLENKVNVCGINTSTTKSVINTPGPNFAFVLVDNQLKPIQLNTKPENNFQDYAIKKIEVLDKESSELSGSPEEDGGSTDSHDITKLSESVKSESRDSTSKANMSLNQSQVRMNQIVHIDSKSIPSKCKPRPILPKAVPVKPVSIELQKAYVKLDHTYAAERNPKRKLRTVEEHLTRRAVIDRIRHRKLHNTDLNPHMDHTYKSEKEFVPKKEKKQKIIKPPKKKAKKAKKSTSTVTDKVDGIKKEKLQQQRVSDDNNSGMQEMDIYHHMEVNEEEVICDNSDELSDMEDMISDNTKTDRMKAVRIVREQGTQLTDYSDDEMSEYEREAEDYNSEDEVYMATRLIEQPAAAEKVLNRNVDESIDNVVLDHIQEFDLMQDLYTTTI